MTARCSFHSTSAAHVSVPSFVRQEHQIGLRPAQMHITKYESPRNPSSVERGLITDSLPHLCPTEHPIEHSPASACPSGNYIASPLPFLEDATTSAMPSPPLPPPPSSSSSSSSRDHLIPRAFHSVERRRRSRPSSHGDHYFSNMTRVERAAVKTASSRRVAFAEHAHQIPSSSSSWTAPDGARPVATATGSWKPKRRPPTPTPIPTGRTMGLSLGLAGTSFDSGERDSSPGFDADVEFECVEVARRSRRAHAGPKERLTIIVPGGKSESYVAMAFERSCSLADDDDDDDDGAAQDRLPSSPSSSIIPPQPTMGLLVAPEAEEGIRNEETNGKTGLKIKIPVPNPLFLLSLRLADSCRVEDEDEAEAGPQDQYPGLCIGGSLEQSAYSPTTTSTSSGGPGSGSGSTMTISQDQGQVSVPVPVPALPLRVGSIHPRSPSRSPTPPVAPPPTPVPENRMARRIARRAGLAPYSAVDRPSLHAARSSKRPYLLPYC